MPVPSKIQDVERLRKCYIDDKMSTTDISKQSETIFGIKISPSSVYNSIIKAGIPLRSKSESVSRASSTLNPDVSFITEEIVEWVDGFLLGDGTINYSSRNNLFSGSRFAIGSSNIEWTLYAMSGLKDYIYSEPRNYYLEKAKNRPNPLYYSRTLTHPDIVSQAKRWYPNRKKIVPLDVRITPTSVMLWYLGDGSFTYQPKTNAGSLRLHTCSFTKDDIENILIPKLEKVGISCWRDIYKGDIHVSSNCFRLFFDFIGYESPIACYDHKFDIPSWLDLKRLSDIVKSDQEKWRATKWAQEGKIECSRSPNGKLFLFTESQAAELRMKLDR